MTAHVRDGGSWKTVSSISVRDGGSWRPVLAGYVKDAGTWKQFFGAGGGGGPGGLSVSAANVISSRSGMAAAGLVTGNTTVSVSGGNGSYTYAWARTSAANPYSGGFSISGSSSAHAGWSAVVNDPDSPHTETWRCTVTDSAGASGYVDVVVRFTWVSLL